MKCLVGFAWYLLMGPLELIGRAAGIYRPRFAPLHAPVTNAPARNTGPVVCFGDSLTSGFGVGTGCSYPDCLLRTLTEMNMDVVNLGRSGDTSAEGVSRVERDVLSLNPKPCAVVVGFGGNDLMQRKPVAETFANLEIIVTRLQQAGCVVVLMGIRGSWLFGVDYETPFYVLAKRTGCALVPLCLDGIWGYPWRMADAAHPNAAGCRILAQRVAEILVPLINHKTIATTETPRSATDTK